MGQYMKQHLYLMRLALLLVCTASLLCGCFQRTSRQPDYFVHMKGVDPETGLSPSWDYEGGSFTIGLPNPDYQASCDDIWVEEDAARSGDPIYDSVIKRKNDMADKYGVTLAVVYSQGDQSENHFVSNSVNAGDGLFDAVMVSGKAAYILSCQGYFRDMYSNEYIDLSRGEIWDQNFVQSMTLNGHLYYLLGEISCSDNRATHAIVFNKNILDKYDFLPDAETFYDMARNGEWTLDKMLYYTEMLRADTDGDGSYTSNDLCGLQYSTDAILAFLQGCGVNIAQRNDRAEYGIQYNGFSAKLDEIWVRIMQTQNHYFARNRTVDFQYEPVVSSIEQTMEEDRVLFYECTVGEIEQMRRYDIEFGILPIPKYDEQQKNYICAAYEYSTMFLSVPISNLDDENTGNILTALAWEGKNTLTPAFYDVTLKGKVVKDVESREMLDIIFSSKSYDLGVFADWSGCSNWIRRGFNEYVFQMSALYERFGSKAKRLIAQQMTTDAYLPLESEGGGTG